MKRIMVITLLITGILFVLLGINTYHESSASLDFFGMEISAVDESGQRSAMMSFILGFISFVASYFVWKKR